MPRVLAVVCLMLAACSGSKVDKEGLFAAPRDLTAALVEGGHIDLHWRHDATAPGGAFVEFTMKPDEPFTILDAVWPGTTEFRHSDVAGDTRFTYRVRPFFGPPSEVVVVDAGHKAPGDEKLIEGAMDGSDAVAPPPASRDHSAFSTQTAPGPLTVRLASGTAAELRWGDRAGAEDGYLVEMSVGAADKGYGLAAILPPNTTSFRKIGLPETTRCYFRVRAFFYGPPSNLASVLTPPETK